MTFCKPYVKENEASSTFSNICEGYKSKPITYAGVVENLDLSALRKKNLNKFVIVHLIIACLGNKFDALKEKIQDNRNTLFDLIGIVMDVALFCML